MLGVIVQVDILLFLFLFQAEDGIRDLVRSRGLGDVYKRQEQVVVGTEEVHAHGSVHERPPPSFVIKARRLASARCWATRTAPGVISSAAAVSSVPKPIATLNKRISR